MQPLWQSSIHCESTTMIAHRHFLIPQHTNFIKRSVKCTFERFQFSLKFAFWTTVLGRQINLFSRLRASVQYFIMSSQVKTNYIDALSPQLTLFTIEMSFCQCDKVLGWSIGKILSSVSDKFRIIFENHFSQSLPSCHLA